MSLPSQAAGKRLIVENISNETVTLFGSLHIRGGKCIDVYVEDNSITETQALTDCTDSSGSLYQETTVTGRIRIRDFDGETISIPDLIYGNQNRIVFSRSNDDLAHSVRTLTGLEYLINNDGDITFYVAADGDDETGDGSENNPYRQIQRAFNDIPDGYNSNVVINCGAGEFEIPTGRIPTVDTGKYITVWGDRSNPEVTFDPKPTFAAKAGRKAVYTADISAYDFTVDDDKSYWLETQSNFFCRAVLDSSSSPNIEVCSRSSIFSPVAIHPYSTLLTGFQIEGNTNLAAIQFVGVYFSSGFNLSISRVGLFGCAIEGCLVLSDISTATGCSSGFTDFFPALNIRTDTFLNAHTTHAQTNFNHFFSINGMISKGNETIFQPFSATSPQFRVANLDQEGTGKLAEVRRGEATFSNVQLIGTVSKLATVSQGGTLILTDDIEGVNPTGDAFELQTGGRLLQAKTYCSSLTPGGNAVVCGEVTVATFAGLPANDFGEAAAQGCFAS